MINENDADDEEAMQTVNSLATLVSAMGTIDYDTGRFVKGERCLGIRFPSHKNCLPSSDQISSRAQNILPFCNI